MTKLEKLLTRAEKCLRRSKGLKYREDRFLALCDANKLLNQAENIVDPILEEEEEEEKENKENEKVEFKINKNRRQPNLLKMPDDIRFSVGRPGDTY